MIAKAKGFEKETGDRARARALKLAIEHCTEHDILKEFLETHSTEVFNARMEHGRGAGF